MPAHFGEALARTLMDVGSPFNITPYGTEALGVMRIEKGHAAGNELDGRTTAGDLGFARMMAKNKDYIGRVMATRVGLTDPERQTLVGLRPGRGQPRLRAGAHLVRLGAAIAAATDQGVVTSVAFSPTLGHWIGLGLLARGSERAGERFRAVDPVRNNTVEVEICSPCFVDPAGERLRA